MLVVTDSQNKTTEEAAVPLTGMDIDDTEAQVQPDKQTSPFRKSVDNKETFDGGSTPVSPGSRAAHKSKYAKTNMTTPCCKSDRLKKSTRGGGTARS